MTDTWHLTFATQGRRPLVLTEKQRRRTVRTIARVANRQLALFCVVDDHLHLVVLCRRPGRLRSALCRALMAVAPSIQSREPTAVEDRHHMSSLVRYVLTQVWHHEVAGAHPALWSGSCFQDMIGARVIDRLQLKIVAALPRFHLAHAFAAVGLSPDLPTVDLDQVRDLGASRIVSAASAALCVGPELKGNTTAAVAARRAAAQLALGAGIPSSEVARASGVTARAVRRLAHQPAASAALHATLTRLALELAVHRPARDR